MKNVTRAVIVAALLCVGLLAGCAGGNQASSASGQAASSDGKVKVVCATFPAYDWVCQVAGDKADSLDITYLMKNGVDLHSYQPSVEEVAKIMDADLFVYVGGESDSWATDAVAAANSSKMHTVNMLEAVGEAAVEEEIVEGMQTEEGHDHEAAEEGHSHEAEEVEYDEHVWLSLKNAKTLVNAIADELSAVDSANAATYAANAKTYCAELDDLDSRYAAAVKGAAKDAVVFADRFPFRYLVDDYNLKYYAAFVGCSAETEASFETVAFLAKKVDELGANCVLVIEDSDQKIAETVVQNTQAKNQQILVMDSLQSTTTDDMAAGKTYLSAMEGNLSVLEKALS